MTGALKRHWMVQHVKKGIKVRPARLTASLTEQIYKTSLRSLQILGVEGYAALDIRMNDAGELFVIDVNPNPNLRKVGISWSRPSFEENVKRIVLAGLRRQSHLPRN
jgi:predicted ATP-grasp superfamily ATP-dependent carboligase